MPSRALRPCLAPRCPNLVQGGYCEAHKGERAKQQDTKTADEAAFYNSRRWRNYRAAYLMRHPLCVTCQAKGVITAAKVVDHVIAMRDGGAAWDEKNHAAMCGSCHQRKRQAEGQARRSGVRK